MAAACLSVAANATILRVSNVTGSSAPYSSINDALDAAIPGDTIMLEGSTNGYGSYVTISKRIVLIGPGYNQLQNGVVNVGANPATLSYVTINYRDVVVQGVTFTGDLKIKKENVVINRCYLDQVILEGGTGAILHQNYFKSGITGYKTTNVTVTNNIFTQATGHYGLITDLWDSYFAYNTCIKERTTNDQYQYFLGGFSGSTVENNILPQEYTATSTNQIANNYVMTESLYYDTSSEKALRTAELAFSEGKYGAFSGDDPFVLSGIPAGAVIEQVTVPASVEKGRKLNVTIKLGIQK